MSKKTILIVILFGLFAECLIAQNNEEKALLKKWHGKEIKYHPNDLDWYQIRKKRKWGLYAGDLEILPKAYDSIGWFKNLDPYVIVKNDDKYGLLLNPFEVENAAEQLQFKFDAIKSIQKDGEYYTKVMHNGKWGLVDWYSGFLVTLYSYETAEDVPLINVSLWSIEIIKTARKKLEADLIEFDSINGDGVFKARNKQTKKWGLYQYSSEDAFDTLIPTQYENIDFISWNAPFTAVYQNNKIGFYLSKWSFGDEAKQSVACLYDAFHKFNFENKIYLAVQKDKKWGWVDWMTGEEKSDFQYATKEELPTPGF